MTAGCCLAGAVLPRAGVYVGMCNQFMVGAFMEKGLTMRGGQTPVQRYWHQLLELIQAGGRLMGELAACCQLNILLHSGQTRFPARQPQLCIMPPSSSSMHPASRPGLKTRAC